MQVFQNISRIRILLPDTLLANEDTLLLKTRKLGQILRTVTIFRTQDVYFYNDSCSPKDKKILQDIIKYILIPPYLRKYYPSLPNLRYTAIIPPLHAPSHTGIQNEQVIYVAGKILSINGTNIKIDVGGKKLIETSQNVSLTKDDDVIVKMNKKTHSVEIVQFPPSFWTTKFHFINSTIDDFLKKNTSHFIIGATKTGQDINNSLLHFLQNQTKKEYLIIFGPIKGSLKKYIKNHELVDIWINFIPSQGTKTVKIEEALHACLAILNINSLNIK